MLPSNTTRARIGKLRVTPRKVKVPLSEAEKSAPPMFPMEISVAS